MSEETRDVLEKAEVVMQRGWLAGYERVAPELVEEIRRLRGFVTRLLDAGTWFHSAIELHTHDGFDGEELEHEAHALLPTGDSDDQ